MSAFAVEVSSLLKADFELLRETPNLKGENKYSKSTIDKLAQYIVCRNYGNLCLELCYLCWPVVELQSFGQSSALHPQAANANGGRGKSVYGSSPLLSFFWLQDTLSSSGFRYHIQAIINDASVGEGYSSKWALNELGLTVEGNKTSFTVSTSRVPLLSAFLEWLLSHFSDLLDELETNMRGTDEKGISKLASMLQKRIYGLLKEHLPAAGTQQKFRYIDSWINQYAELSVQQEEKAVISTVIDDQVVLDFWQQSAGQEGYIRFQTAFNELLDFKYALEANETEAKVGFALGAAFEGQLAEQAEEQANDDVDNVVERANANQVFDYISNHDKTPLAYEFLYTRPKSVSKTQYQDVANLIQYHYCLAEFPLSLLRLGVFSPLQSVLVQSSRSKKLKAFDISYKLDNALGESAYGDYLQTLMSWSTYALNASLCCATVLFAQKDARFLLVLIDAHELLQSTEEAQQESQRLQTPLDGEDNTTAALVTSLRHGKLSFTEAKQYLLGSSSLQSTLKEATNRFKKNNKAGFQNSSHFVEAQLYLDSNNAVMHCLELSEALKHKLKALSDGGNCTDVNNYDANLSFDNWLQEKYRSDLFIFKSELEKRHGEVND